MKTLIVYATKQGTAKLVAEKLKTKLIGETELVDLNVNSPRNLIEYDNIILGGSIYIGKIQKQMKSFVEENLSLLLNKRVCVYICAAEKNEKLEKELTDAFPEALLTKALFRDRVGESIDFNRLNFFNRMITKKVMGTTQSYVNIDEKKIDKIAKALLK